MIFNPPANRSRSLRALPPGEQIRRIAIFRALFLGDLLMTTPAFRALRRRFPQAEITLISLPWVESFIRHLPGLIDRFVVFEGYPGIIEVPVDPERTARFLEEQRAYGYDLALQMHGSGTITNGLVAEFRPRLSAGLALPGDRCLTYTVPYRKDRNEVLRWLDLLAPLGAETDDTTLVFEYGPGDAAAADALLAELPGDGPLIALHVGAKDPLRRWPPERFAAVGDALAARYGARLVLTGAEGERPLIDAAHAALHAPALNLCGRTSLGALAALMDRLDLLVSNDTGASHMAAAVGAPSVVLFGPTRPGEFSPLNRELHRVVDALDLAPAAFDGAEALRLLRPEDVLAACEPALAAAPLRARALGTD